MTQQSATVLARVKWYGYYAVATVGFLLWVPLSLAVGLSLSIAALMLGLKQKNMEESIKFADKQPSLSPLGAMTFAPKLALALFRFLLWLFWKAVSVPLGIPLDTPMGGAVLWAFNSIPANAYPNHRTFTLGCGGLGFAAFQTITIIL
ncbi:hypothetical protein VF14_18280 [Nostoc linckia z18]|uniref:Uncharacterized protein n=2 Tax=Nostoc linckia TaxID=92942 RepID=A0A9Q5Z943_NOSLI|nr:hypothetical protein [Nostoc linckia]PHJ52790.1 hypothetical protein VF02_37490 [Nostoc linckia z1]PHJ81981.1 hypothetical protein VF07_29250 [Nostoc linckia z6]PHJ92880.1 hypothetical protein VF04_27965 [Nostoc linckia z7]PHK00798.1 hypothetical protein VF08_23280 [Nostoc linckia z8]PHK09325.1 hypothetical protein VF09_16025 [Nostoc linckia z9]